MELILILLIAAAIFGICYLVDKTFTKMFRSKAQHRSGLAVRVNRRYGIFGVVLTVLGILAVCVGITDGVVLLVGGIAVLCGGLAMAFYYLTCGIFYDGESFLRTTFGKESKVYYFRQIRQQKLYLIQGGSIAIELSLDDGTVLMLQSGMDGVYPFLDTAFAGWCLQKGIDPQSCDFHDPSKSWWFPQGEEEDA